MEPKDMDFYKKSIDKIVPKGVKIKYITPKSPNRIITYFEEEKKRQKKRGKSSKYPAWFDYITDKASEKIEEEEEINTSHVDSQRVRIHKIIDRQVQYHNGHAKRVFISGYSQGACMSLDAGLTFPQKIGGIIGFKGYILSHTGFKKTYKQDIFVSHGKADRTIFFSVAKKSYNKYKKKGYNIKFIEQDRVNHNMENGKLKEFTELKKWLQIKL